MKRCPISWQRTWKSNFAGCPVTSTCLSGDWTHQTVAHDPVLSHRCERLQVCCAVIQENLICCCVRATYYILPKDTRAL